MSDTELLSFLLGTTICASGPFFFFVSIALAIAYLKQRQKTKDFERLVHQLKQDAFRASRNEWLKGIVETNYRNEIEVEIKFIHPLLKFLGYDSNSFQIRVPVTVQVGRQQTRGEADWVIWGGTASGGQRQASIVIEAKEARQELDTAVQGQARSYAFGLNAPLYVLTNGRRLRIFRRGVQGDTCLVDCNVSNLAESWPKIEQTIGADACEERQITS